MSKTDHSKYDRHKNKNPKGERRQRQILSRALAHDELDSLPTRLPTREIRTYTAL